MVNFKQIIICTLVYTFLPFLATADDEQSKYSFSMYEHNVPIIDGIQERFKQPSKLLLIGFAFEQINDQTIKLTDLIKLPAALNTHPNFSSESTFKDLLESVIYFSADDAASLLLYNLEQPSNFKSKMDTYLEKLKISPTFQQDGSVEFTTQELLILQDKLLNFYPDYSQLIFAEDIEVDQVFQKNPNIITNKPNMKIIVTSKFYQEGGWFISFIAKTQNHAIAGITQQNNKNLDIDNIYIATNDTVDDIVANYQKHKLFTKGQQLVTEHLLPDGQKVTLSTQQDIELYERNDLDKSKMKAKVLINANSLEDINAQLVIMLPNNEQRVFSLDIK